MVQWGLDGGRAMMDSGKWSLDGGRAMKDSGMAVAPSGALWQRRWQVW
jgi:hypothetical protein